MSRGPLLAEGAVIVASILLAFGIDALWEERQTRVQEREALAALRSEFTANLDQIERVIGRHVGARQRVETLVTLTEQEIRGLPQEEISAYMVALCNPWSFDPITGTTDALISSGELEILRERPLRESLTTVVNLFSDAAEDVAYLAWSARQVWLAQVEHGGPWSDPETEIAMSGDAVVSPEFVPRASADDLFHVRGDERFMGLVGLCHLNTGYYVSELERLRAQVTRVLDLIGRPG